MLGRLKYLLPGIFLLGIHSLNAQKDFIDQYRGNSGVRIGFYNVENLFDIYNDSLKRDDEFTPDGQKHWNNTKYYSKLQHISKVVTALGGWEPVEVMAFCELENRFVLEQLISETALKNTTYKIVHFESPDRRGIDVGFIYRPDKIEVLYAEPIPIVFPWDSSYKTRDILYAKLLIQGKDTLHFYVNHWPSRWGGQLETEDARMHVAKTLKKHIIDHGWINDNVVVVGDFNDTPEDRSIKEVLSAELDTAKLANVYNLMYPYHGKRGTHKYHGEWSILDQVIVSKGLLNAQKQIRIKDQKALIYDADFLLESDKKYEGEQVFRTYLGMRYLGGYSDHLPVYIDLNLK